MDAETFLKETAPAIEAMFKTLNRFGWDKMRAVVDAVNSKTLPEVHKHKSKFYAKDVARDVLAGAILQIAYTGIEKYGQRGRKPAGVIEFENEINAVIRTSKTTRWSKTRRLFELPKKFCVGREIGLLPIGVIVYAARNQHHHPFEERWKVENEVVFNYLHQGWPKPPNGLSFDIYDERTFYAFSVLSVLGWVPRDDHSPYEAYHSDMSAMLDVTRVSTPI